MKHTEKLEQADKVKIKLKMAVAARLMASPCAPNGCQTKEEVMREFDTCGDFILDACEQDLTKEELVAYVFGHIYLDYLTFSTKMLALRDALLKKTREDEREISE